MLFQKGEIQRLKRHFATTKRLYSDVLRQGNKSEALTNSINAKIARSRVDPEKSQNIVIAKAARNKIGFNNKNTKKSTKSKLSQEANVLPLNNRFAVLQNTISCSNIGEVGSTAFPNVRTKMEKTFSKKAKKLDSVHITDHGDLDKVCQPPLLGTAKSNGPQRDHGDLDGEAATLHNRLNAHGPLKV